MTTVAFDFRKPPPGELERQMGKWLTLTMRQAAGVWARLLPYPTDLKPGPVVGVSAGHGLSQLSTTRSAYRLQTRTQRMARSCSPSHGRFSSAYSRA